ncbi:lysylphosphatidylglycerol synthase transmembrane domain-containing protein [Corynebacterium renale]|uniref:lysylphosphatidylglycerol synthase transmembrane domain-containing protein n=1 Tax=Corynebacterium renale TaxID=1724 RepID=UPI000E0413AC|nr:YbhN family protein [Corynebacterium renale]STD00137.1 putative integral membrane protein [Corynebacterium renale]
MLDSVRRFVAKPWVRWAAIAVLIAFLVGVVATNGDYLRDGLRHVADANPWYILGACAVAVITMFCQAEVMVVLLRATGVDVPRVRANLLGWEANAWSASLPGGPAVSAAMIFREQLKWGASSVVASWYLVVSGVLAGAGMALLALPAVFFYGAKIQPATIAFSLLGLVATLWLVSWLAHNPHRVEAAALAVVRWWNRVTKADPDRWVDSVHSLTSQLSAVDVPLRRVGLALGWSVANWITEMACLWLCIRAVGGEPAIAGVALAFLGAKLVGQVQVTPGGLGPVDVALTSMLVPLAELPMNEVLAAVIIFRLISFVGVTAVGWLLFLIGQVKRVE